MLALGLAPAWCAQAQTHYDVYLLAGQSNATGRGDSSDLTGVFSSPQSDVLFYYHKTLDASNNILPEDQLIPLAPGAGHGKVSPVNSSEFGAEVSFGRTMADARPDRNILIIKYSHGGSNLHTQWSPTGEMFPTLVDTVTAALSDLADNGDSYDMQGMMWVQGESDTGGTNATGYGANLQNLIGRARTELFGGEDAAFVFSRLSANQYNSIGGGVGTVRDQQQWVEQNVAMTTLIDTDGAAFTTRPGDMIHFDAAGQVALGEAMAAAMLQYSVPEPGTLCSMGLLGSILFSRRTRRERSPGAASHRGMK